MKLLTSPWLTERESNRSIGRGEAEKQRREETREEEKRMSVMGKKRVKATDGWYNRYGLTEVPRWQYGHGGEPPLNLPVKNEKGDADVVTWSAKFDPPPIGAEVRVSVNGIGISKVVGYFVEYGWLGLCVLPLAPPAWYVKQNGRDAVCGVMGAELKH